MNQNAELLTPPIISDSSHLFNFSTLNQTVGGVWQEDASKDESDSGNSPETEGKAPSPASHDLRGPDVDELSHEKAAREHQLPQLT